MSDASIGTTPRATPAPWERFAWVVAVVWLIFLGFPLAAAAQADVLIVWRAVAVLAILAFAALYVYGFVKLPAWERQGEAARLGLRVLAGMVALALVAAVVVGGEIAGVTTYLMVFGIFSQPMRRAFLMAAGWVVVTTVVLLVSGIFSTLWFLVVVNILVGAFTGAIRWLDAKAIDHDRLSRELDLVAERERVARDVHDVLGHSLTVVTVKAELAERLVDADPKAAQAELAQIRSLTREALGEIRATVAGLRVSRLGDELDSARAALADAGISADLPDDGDVVDPRHRLVLAWVLREAVTNVVRHSRAATCTIRLGPASLEVIDDGVGLDGGIDGAAESTGLRGIRERVGASGGTLVLEAASGGGDGDGRGNGDGGSDAGGDGGNDAGGDGARPGTRLEVRW